MYSVPQSYINRISEASITEGDETVSGKITLADGSVINISENDIEQGSLYISGQMTDNSELEVGSAPYYEMGMTLLNFSGNAYSLENASVKLNYGLKTDSGWVYVPIWKFIIDRTSINRRHKSVNFRANGLLMLFDDYINDADDTETDNINLEDKTAFELLTFCCDGCGITLLNTKASIETMPNGKRIYTVTDSVETFRDLICWVCTALGAFARMSRDDELEIVQITAETVNSEPVPARVIPENLRTNTTFSDTLMRVNAVTSYFGGKRRGYKIKADTSIFRLIIPENPIVNISEKNEQYNFLSELYYSLIKVRYQGFSTDYIGDIALDCGDFIKLTDGEIDNGKGYVIGLLTSFNWRFRGMQKLQSVGGLGNSPAPVSGQTDKTLNNAALTGNNAGTVVYYDVLTKDTAFSSTRKELLSIAFSALSNTIPIYGATVQLNITTAGVVTYELIYDNILFTSFNQTVSAGEHFHTVSLPLLGTNNGGHKIVLAVKGEGAAGTAVREKCYAYVNGSKLSDTVPWDGTVAGREIIKLNAGSPSDRSAYIDFNDNLIFKLPQQHLPFNHEILKIIVKKPPAQLGVYINDAVFMNSCFIRAERAADNNVNVIFNNPVKTAGNEITGFNIYVIASAKAVKIQEISGINTNTLSIVTENLNNYFGAIAVIYNNAEGNLLGYYSDNVISSFEHTIILEDL